MRASAHTSVIFLAAILLFAGCSRERSRVLDEPRAPIEETRNYQETLDRIRSRRTPIQIQESLEQAIRKFQSDFSRLPTNLLELVERRYLPEIKPAPPGFAYSYNPTFGNVSLVPITEDGRYRAPSDATNQASLNMSSPTLPPPPGSIH